MKNVIGLFGLATVVVFALAFASCGGGGGGDDTVGKPTATPASGAVYHNTAVTLETATPGAQIYYTQNGTNPTAESTLYGDSTKPTITADKLTLKAIAIKTGMNDSEILSVTYTITTLNATVSFVTLGDFSPGVTTLNFSPNAALPAGVTYVITNDKTNKTWNNTGTVSATDFVGVNDDVLFTQTFYLNGTEIAESKRTVKVVAYTFMGTTDFSFISDSGSVTLKYP